MEQLRKSMETVIQNSLSYLKARTLNYCMQVRSVSLS